MTLISFSMNNSINHHLIMKIIKMVKVPHLLTLQYKARIRMSNLFLLFLLQRHLVDAMTPSATIKWLLHSIFLTLAQEFEDAVGSQMVSILQMMRPKAM